MRAIHNPIQNKITTKLVAIFLDSTGKKHQWTYADVDPSLSPSQLRAYCEQIAQLDLFEKEGVLLFAKLLRAKLVTTIETPIFDLTDPVDHDLSDNEPPIQTLSPVDIQIDKSPIRSLSKRWLTLLKLLGTKKRKRRLLDYGFT
ncbi:DUF2922 family protein [Enterococcus hermanniensis]|uniref:Uncharacterized protein n=1 Tax=Enterococcus hermanniensis TaxID=249189 RepID=A0A1L8TSD8_9ENTE|nr:DUF2922 family protein [Enterococcus hermanniensis]OJG47072.1 hypothetical protein RV04_GL000319 [Enterococcus hermanniensis]